MLELSSRNNLFIQQNNIKLLTSWDCSKWLILHHRSTISSVKHQKVFYKILHNHSNFKNLISSQQDYEKLKTTILSLYEKKKAKISRQAHDNFANNRKTLYIFTQNVCHQVIQALPSFISPIITSKKDLSPAQLCYITDKLLSLLQHTKPINQTETKENWTQ